MRSSQTENLLQILRLRFDNHPARHPDIEWSSIQSRLENNWPKLSALLAMEESGGEPDVIGYDSDKDSYIYCDCAQQSPKGRRSICYDHAALEARKKYPPEDSAMRTAQEMGIKMLTPEEYRELQKLGPFDTKTSSWVKTPPDIREKGGALFGDHRYGVTFIYHNGADSYYAARGFRGKLLV